MKITPKSVFRRGAENGAFFGIYLSLFFIFTTTSLQIPLLGHIASIMAILVPVYIYFTLRKGFVENGCFYTFTEVWTHGIIIFACGSLIMATTIVAYLTWIEPSFFIKLYDILKNTGKAESEITKMLGYAIQQNLLPSPISFAKDIITISIFSGSILSIILTPFVRRVSNTRNSTNQ